MNYLKSEHLKFKGQYQTTAFHHSTYHSYFCMDSGRLHRFQYMTLYWWYEFLLPGAIAIFMFLITPERRKTQEILFCIFYALEPFKI